MKTFEKIFYINLVILGTGCGNPEENKKNNLESIETFDKNPKDENTKKIENNRQTDKFKLIESKAKEKLDDAAMKEFDSAFKKSKVEQDRLIDAFKIKIKNAEKKIEEDKRNLLKKIKNVDKSKKNEIIEEEENRIEEEENRISKEWWGNKNKNETLRTQENALNEQLKQLNGISGFKKALELILYILDTKNLIILFDTKKNLNKSYLSCLKKLKNDSSSKVKPREESNYSSSEIKREEKVEFDEKKYKDTIKDKSIDELKSLKYDLKEVYKKEEDNHVKLVIMNKLEFLRKYIYKKEIEENDKEMEEIKKEMKENNRIYEEKMKEIGKEFQEKIDKIYNNDSKNVKEKYEDIQKLGKKRKDEQIQEEIKSLNQTIFGKSKNEFSRNITQKSKKELDALSIELNKLLLRLIGLGINENHEIYKNLIYKNNLIDITISKKINEIHQQAIKKIDKKARKGLQNIQKEYKEDQKKQAAEYRKYWKKVEKERNEKIEKERMKRGQEQLLRKEQEKARKKQDKIRKEQDAKSAPKIYLKALKLKLEKKIIFPESHSEYFKNLNLNILKNVVYLPEEEYRILINTKFHNIEEVRKDTINKAWDKKRETINKALDKKRETISNAYEKKDETINNAYDKIYSNGSKQNRQKYINIKNHEKEKFKKIKKGEEEKYKKLKEVEEEKYETTKKEEERKALNNHYRAIKKLAEQQNNKSVLDELERLAKANNII